MNHLLTSNKIPKLTLALIFFTMLPVTMIVPVFKDLVKDRLGGDNLMVSLFMSYAMLGSFLFSPVAGFLSDKFKNRKYFISVFAILDGICFFLLVLADNLQLLQIIRFLEGVCHIFVIGLLLSLIADRENDSTNEHFYKKGILMGLAGMFLSLGVGIGSPMGVLGKKNPLLPFYVAGTIMICIGIISFLLLHDYEFIYHERITFQKWSDAFQKNRLILIPYLYNFIDRFTVGFFVTSFNLHLREELQFSAGEVGLYLSLVLIPMSLFSYPFARIAKKTGPFLLMMVGSLLYGISLGISGGVNDKVFLFTLLILCGTGAGVMFVPSMMLASQMSPKGMNASVMAGFTGVGSIGFMLGPIASTLMERFLKTNFESDFSFSILSLLFGSLEVLVVLFTFPFRQKLKEAIQ
ncbi:MAG TPA: MFS transporter [Leptospiraceae bacterium]|nr:MFS transporter [Leptospiraceae bacterium]HMW03854.1 MFS transporter [Leptospiraceae bacterium]HMX32903.1 MFS transporter [Leptospiraceae bacterium]HMY29834.1 MFS transporter [Leptospiraceae bacterium]HMZ65184.1 MFS transporter [Leptospiraceae bacterium]